MGETDIKPIFLGMDRERGGGKDPGQPGEERESHPAERAGPGVSGPFLTIPGQAGRPGRAESGPGRRTRNGVIRAGSGREPGLSLRRERAVT